MNQLPLKTYLVDFLNTLFVSPYLELRFPSDNVPFIFRYLFILVKDVCIDNYYSFQYNAYGDLCLTNLYKGVTYVKITIFYSNFSRT